MKTGAVICVLLSGALFGAGLAFSTMVQPEVVLAFLRLTDFGLLLVLGGAVAVTFTVYRLAPRQLSQPCFAAAFLQHAAELNMPTLVGAAIFGVGWGISGVCPGPAIAGIGAGNWPLLWSLGAMFLGAWVQGRFFAVR